MEGRRGWCVRGGRSGGRRSVVSKAGGCGWAADVRLVCHERRSSAVSKMFEVSKRIGYEELYSDGI